VAGALASNPWERDSVTPSMGGSTALPDYGGNIQAARPANLAPGTGSAKDQQLMAAGNLAGVSDRIAAIFDNRGLSLQSSGGTQEGPWGSSGGETREERLSRISNQVLSGARTFDEIRASADWQARKAPKPLPALSAGDLSALDGRRRQATRSFAEALAQQQAQEAELDLSRSRGINDLTQRFDQARFDGRTAYADIGQARNPRQKGRLFRTLRDGESQGRADLLAQDAMQRNALNSWVEQARIARDDEIQAIEEDKVRLRSDPSRLYAPINF